MYHRRYRRPGFYCRFPSLISLLPTCNPRVTPALPPRYPPATPLIPLSHPLINRLLVRQAGLGDVLIGAAATVAEYNGAARASHVRDKLVEMAHLNETIAGTSLAASHGSAATAAGNFQPDVLMANVCKHNVTRFPYEMARLAQDLAGAPRLQKYTQN